MATMDVGVTAALPTVTQTTAHPHKTHLSRAPRIWQADTSPLDSNHLLYSKICPAAASASSDLMEGGVELRASGLPWAPLEGLLYVQQ